MTERERERKPAEGETEEGSGGAGARRQQQTMAKERWATVKMGCQQGEEDLRGGGGAARETMRRWRGEKARAHDGDGEATTPEEKAGAHGLNHGTGITMGSSGRPEKGGSGSAAATNDGEEKRR